MCGIAGILALDGAPDIVRPVEAMTRSLAHRGPDGEGFWSDPDAGIAVGHRRLSIVDLSAAGSQPMLSHSGRYVLTFNGEIYNHRALRRSLDTEALINWRGSSDTEVMLEAIAHWGVVPALRRCAGMFAFALWDRTDRTVTLARDRAGEKPLAVYRRDTLVAFASEVRAFHAVPGFTAEIDRAAASDMIRNGFVTAPRSIYSNVSKLRPGQLMIVSREGRADQTIDYGAGPDEDRAPAFHGSIGAACADAERLVMQSVSEQMIADVPLGCFLSGGIDSSLVAAIAQEISAVPVRTFSIGFSARDYDEAPYARAVARHLKTEHTELYCSEQELLAVVPRLGEIYDEPFADASQVPTVMLAMLAAHKVKVALTGDGGDEVFAGYARHAFIDRWWDRLQSLPLAARRLIERQGPRMANLASPGSGRFGDRARKAFSAASSATVAEFHGRLLAHWNDGDDIVPGTGWTRPNGQSAELQTSALRHMLALDAGRYLPDDVLVKVDRATMRAGMESRAPLLDYRLAEFAATLPDDLLIRDGKPKWLLRELLYRRVPKALVDRPKQGFSVPISAWLRGPLKTWAADTLNPDTLGREGLINARRVHDVWTAHQRGDADHGHRLWTVLMFQTWKQAQSATPIPVT